MNWLSVTVRAGRYRITIPRDVVEHNIGPIGGRFGAQPNNIFQFCYERLLKERPDAKDQLSFSLTYNATEKPLPKRKRK